MFLGEVGPELNDCRQLSFCGPCRPCFFMCRKELDNLCKRNKELLLLHFLYNNYFHRKCGLLGNNSSKQKKILQLKIDFKQSFDHNLLLINNLKLIDAKL